MKNPGMQILHAKARGEWAELRFILRAIELGFRPTKPWGDCSPYDVATDHHGHFARVQVKCTIYKRWNSYVCSLTANHVPYSPDEIDFIAAYIIPTDTWYILPIEATNGQSDILLTPHRKNAKYAKYKEAWPLLKR
jgi:hypothetical protein